ncbi:hypothetical protein B0T22DRAFT_79727 [Podospora appendiculata]|uniref:Uncharacterized protein n=1 Tax=Podospora appendiculata TaxID=314037 RepID=A0AAE0XJZ4_9PEZI|nr:hypothetical protein B0T22DRAFT_79727 [Podospora appendiculata]
MEVFPGRASDAIHDANVERTLRELQRVKDEAENTLNQLRRAAVAPNVPLSADDSMEIMAKACQDVAESEPFLPFHGSVLPALLALRKTHRTISESSEYINSQAVSLEQVNKRLELLRADVKQQLVLQTALQKRAQSLRDDMENRMERTPEQIASDLMAELKKKKQDYDRETSKLLKSLNWFIDHHLGPMLAAEELGGPIVGDLMDIDPEELGAGFSAQGKLKKAKAQPDEHKRQRRIDDIWGSTSAPAQQEQARKRKRERDEGSAAGAEMRDLTEQLLNKSMEAGGDSTAAYVTIPRESAAARFLVRSKVAVFHPRDATKLRLIDFGREVE